MTNGSAAARFTSQPEGHRYHTERNGTRRKRSFFILSSLPGGPKWVYIHENCLLTVVERVLNTKDGSTKEVERSRWRLGVSKAGAWSPTTFFGEERCI